MTKKKSKQIKKSKQARVKTSKTTLTAKNIPTTLIVTLVLFVLGLIYMIRIESAYVDFGIDRDEAAYSLFGESLRTGGAMYKDTYSFKPPAIYYTYAMINTIFGFSPSGLRWSVIVSNMLAAMLLFFLAHRWKGPVFALIAAGAYLFFEFNPYVFGFAAVAEQYQNLITILALVLVQHGAIKRKWLYLILGGFAMTYCVLLKQNMIFVYFALACTLGWYFIFSSPNRQWKPVLNFILGSAIATVVIFIPVIVQGNFSNWVYWNLTYSSIYVSAIPWERGQELCISFAKMVTRFNLWMWIAGVIGVVAGIIQAKSSTAKIGIGLFFITAVMSIIPGLHFYPHYWSYFSPILAIGCAWVTETIMRLLSIKLKKHWSQLIAGGLFFGGLIYVVQNNKLFFDDPQELMINRSLYGNNPFTETRYLGEYLKKQIQPSDEVLLLGSEPEIFNYLERPPSRPDMFFSIMLIPHERREAMVKATQEWAQREKPKYVYLSNHPFSWSATKDANLTMYQWAHAFVRQNYKVIAVADIIPQQAPQLVFGEPAATYQPLSETWVKIYERTGN